MHKSSCNNSDRRALHSIAWQFWLNGTLFAAFIPRLPELRDQLDISIDQLGQALSIAMLGGMVGSISVDYACRFLGVKQLMMVAALLMVAVLGSIAFTTALWAFALLLAAMTLLDVYVDVAMNIQGSQLSERASKPVMNRLHGLWSVGSVCGSASAAIAISLGWTLQQQLLMIAAFSYVLLLYIFIGLRQPLNDTGSTQPLPSANRPWLMVLAFALLGAAAIIPEMVSSDWSAFRIRDDLDQSNQMASLGFVVFGTGMMVGRLGGDEVMYRIGKSRTIFIASLAALLGIATVAFIDQVHLVLIGLALAGLGISVFFPTLYDYAVKASGKGAVMLGAMSIGSRLGAAALPITVGYLAAEQGVWSAYAFLALPAILVIMLVTKWLR